MVILEAACTDTNTSTCTADTAGLYPSCLRFAVDREAPRPAALLVEHAGSARTQTRARRKSRPRAAWIPFLPDAAALVAIPSQVLPLGNAPKGLPDLIAGLAEVEVYAGHPSPATTAAVKREGRGQDKNVGGRRGGDEKQSQVTSCYRYPRKPHTVDDRGEPSLVLGSPSHESPVPGVDRVNHLVKRTKTSLESSRRPKVIRYGPPC